MTTTLMAQRHEATASPGGGRLLAAGVLSAALFITGMLLPGLIPGGGTTDDKSVTDFYDGSGPGTAIILIFGLLGAAICLVWFFSELADRLGDGVQTQVGLRLAMLGAGLLFAGGAIMIAPSAALEFSEAKFVGVPAAIAFVQAGMGLMLIGGVWMLAVAAIVLSLCGRSVEGYPTWLVWSGVGLGVLALGAVVWLPAFLLAVWFVLAGFGARAVHAVR